MISTPAQLLQTSLLLYRIAKYHGTGEGVGVGVGMMSEPAQLLQTSLLLHPRSTAADQPAPGLQINMLWGGGGGRGDKHTFSTAADQPAPLPDCKGTWVGGVGMMSTPAQLLQARLLLYRLTK